MSLIVMTFVYLLFGVFVYIDSQKRIQNMEQRIVQLSDSLKSQSSKNDQSHEIKSLKRELNSMEYRLDELEEVVDDIDRFTSQNRFLLAE